MITVLKGLIPASLCDDILTRLDEANFVDGLGTVGKLDSGIKQNLQLPPREPMARKIAGDLLGHLTQSREFARVTRLKRIAPPRINRYDKGMFYGDHLDNVFMPLGQKAPLRTDIAVTICLHDAADYEGGELIVQADGAEHRFRGDRGDAIVYPAGFVHQVTPVTVGRRVVAVSWIQSQVKDAGQRQILHDLDQAIEVLDEGAMDRADLLKLRQARNALLRMWSEP